MEIKQEICDNFNENLNSPLTPKIIQDCHSKCGEVFLSSNGTFLFHCDICDKKFENFKFFLHISTDHAEMLNKRIVDFSEITTSTTPTNTMNYEINCNPNEYLVPTTTPPINNNQLNYDNLSTVYPTTKVNYNQPPIRKYHCNTNKTKHPYDWEYDTQIETLINFIRNTPKYLITGSNFKQNKERIFKPLSEQLNMSVEQILRKFKYLKSKLSSERRILLERRLLNDFTYEPTWGWYESFKFWDDDIVTYYSKKSSVPLISPVKDIPVLNTETSLNKTKLVNTYSNNQIEKRKISKNIKTFNQIEIVKNKIDKI